MCRASWYFAKSASGEPNAIEQIKKAGTPTLTLLRIMSILAVAGFEDFVSFGNGRAHSGRPTVRPAVIAVL
jgi:hypothetical protein